MNNCVAYVACTAHALRPCVFVHSRTCFSFVLHVCGVGGAQACVACCCVLCCELRTVECCALRARVECCVLRVSQI